MWRWVRATRLPKVMVRIATAAMNGRQTSDKPAKATYMICSSPTKPAVFDATDRNAATGTGDPSYVSGTHHWNGNAETLKPKPTTTKKTDSTAIDRRTGVADRWAAIWARFVVPVTPYT